MYYDNIFCMFLTIFNVKGGQNDANTQNLKNIYFKSDFDIF
jgi:hypothetical protein